MKQLNDNPGIIPIKLGTAKLRQSSFTLIHYYDLNPLILEINTLNIKSNNLTLLIYQNKNYTFDSINYLNILNVLQERVNSEINQIIPRSDRIKRGLINALGSVFKTISGNLDASDGERYNTLINNLQTNQKNLAENILKQNSLSLRVINKFNSTVKQILHNEKLLEFKINQIEQIVQGAVYRENSMFIKDTLIQLINIYEIVDNVLQDIENSIAFSKSRIFHSSIVKTEDLFNELINIQNIVGIAKMPLNVTFENILILEKIIEVECYILNNRITYLLKIPLTFKENFDYFHLYSVPVFVKSLFKVVIAKNKFLLKNKLHYTFQTNKCHDTRDQLFICDESDVREVKDQDSCAVQLLDEIQNLSQCHQIEAQISHSFSKQLSSSNNWIYVTPFEEIINLKCLQQEESVRIIGTYLLEIPSNCQVKTNNELITNSQKTIKFKTQPFLFSDFHENTFFIHSVNLSAHIDNVNLDELYKLKSEIKDNKPQLVFEKVSAIPSAWTIGMYVLLFIVCIYVAWKKWKTPTPQQRDVPLEDVRLP